MDINYLFLFLLLLDDIMSSRRPIMFIYVLLNRLYYRPEHCGSIVMGLHYNIIGHFK